VGGALRTELDLTVDLDCRLLSVAAAAIGDGFTGSKRGRGLQKNSARASSSLSAEARKLACLSISRARLFHLSTKDESRKKNLDNIDLVSRRYLSDIRPTELRDLCYFVSVAELDDQDRVLGRKSNRG